MKRCEPYLQLCGQYLAHRRGSPSLGFKTCKFHRGLDSRLALKIWRICHYWTFILTLSGVKKQQSWPLPVSVLGWVVLHTSCCLKFGWLSPFTLPSQHPGRPLQPHFPLGVTPSLCLPGEACAELWGRSRTPPLLSSLGTFWPLSLRRLSKLSPPGWPSLIAGLEKPPLAPLPLCLVVLRAPLPGSSTASCSLVVALSTLCGSCWITCLSLPDTGGLEGRVCLTLLLLLSNTILGTYSACAGVLSRFSRVWLCLCDPTDCSLPGSSVHRIFQARILQWVARSSRGSSWPRD